MNFKTLILPGALFLSGAATAEPIEYDAGRFNLKLSGYGTIATIDTSKTEKPLFFNDWRARGQLNYALSEIQAIGLVYAIDVVAFDDKEPARDAFMLFEDSGLGRVELGITDSIATKMGVGLPDVGGLRVVDSPIFYKNVGGTGNVISNTTLSSGKYNLRANFATVPSRTVQYGLSVAGLSDDSNYSGDISIKIRRPDGKTKTSFSAAASYIDAPVNMSTDIYSSNITADSRTQISAGMNLQYNSWIWGLSGRVIYDDDGLGAPSDGVAVGTGVSYDILNYSVSATYLLSDTGIWDREFDDYIGHATVFSFRYKYSAEVDMWISTGIALESPFISAGFRVKL